MTGRHWTLIAVTFVLLQTWRGAFVNGRKVVATTEHPKGGQVGNAAPKGRSIGKSSSTQTEDGSVPPAVPALKAVADPKQSSWGAVKEKHCSTNDGRTICSEGPDKTKNSKEIVTKEGFSACPAWKFIDENECRILDSGCHTFDKSKKSKTSISDASYYTTPWRGRLSATDSWEKIQIGMESNYSLTTFRAVNLSGTLACEAVETWYSQLSPRGIRCYEEDYICPQFVAKILHNPSYWYEDRAVVCNRNVSLLRRYKCLHPSYPSYPSYRGEDALYRAAIDPKSCLKVGDFCVFDEDCGCNLTCVTNFKCEQLFTNEDLANLKDFHIDPYTWDISKETKGDPVLFKEKVYARVKSDRMQCRKIGNWSLERWEQCLQMWETHFFNTSVEDSGTKRTHRSWCATTEGCGKGLECVKFICTTIKDQVTELCSKELDMDSRRKKCLDRGLFLWKKNKVSKDATTCAAEGNFCIRDEDCCMYASFKDPKNDLLLCTGYPFYTCLPGIHVAMPCNVTKDVGYKSVEEEVCGGPEGNAEAEKEVTSNGRSSQPKASLEKLFLDFYKTLKGSKEERAELCKKSNIVAKFCPEPIEGNGICKSAQTESDNRKALAIQAARMRKWCWELDKAAALVCTSKLDAYIEKGYLNVRRNCIAKGKFCIPSQFRGCCNGLACDKGKFICRDGGKAGDDCKTADDCESLDWRIGLRPICPSEKKCMYVERGGGAAMAGLSRRDIVSGRIQPAL